MIASLTLHDVAQVTGGSVVGDAQLAFDRVGTDTRKLSSGSLFIALAGENFDGHDFLSTAKEAGAIASVVAHSEGVLPEVVVDDTQLALGQIAGLNRGNFNGGLVGLTGSSGKTSTKEMVAAILAEAGSVYATRGNLNNEIGVPLSLLELDSQHQFAVIEMGAAKAGDIAYLCQFVKPKVAILTNAQPAHIAGFGSLDGVASTKGEIFTALEAGGVAVINADDQYAALWQNMASHCSQKLFSIEKTADVWASEITPKANGGSEFLLHTEQGDRFVSLPLSGKHMVANALAATAAAMAVGANLDHVVTGLASLKSVSGRLYRQTISGVTLIDDSYNANPGSVKAAIDVLATSVGRKVLVLGAMAELGADAQAMHVDVAKYASEAGIDLLLVCGAYAELMAAAFDKSAERAVAFVDKAELTQDLIKQTKENDTILIKGSRSSAMDRVVNEIEASLKARSGGVN
ncbi:UDP-N-acetylmuramoyl-tripeptide--D-alanyl-D-alanine ligase [Spongiibacter sp. KMU-158]|uniref:UDP-N-acetylmuramoyl-tripeptide--D-alanyl-D-alanine ligase n=1 Tax=Spongiibacter pelagi TaxID=2760804 RepID=A0A927C534_9GAMM|nr:UDP-N-acetylmuramoyl-tripeptide--D-alanyl-D-alanine ligase [Spongiibacter pelagi]MBD2859736.1 UDP-N-acetylmuramoyl-tripeptide--D-alanyl-D-alanine ligase [Spongiibacter pelagi]